MDSMFTWIIAAVVAVPVLAVVSFLIAMGARGRIRQLELRIAGLEWQVARLAEGIAPAEAAPPLPEAAPEAVEQIEAEAQEPPPPSEPLATPEPARSAAKKISLEERFGTQWVVWAGGIALALGGFFLVRQAIEQGWFGPSFQVLLGAAVALALIAAGEWARRREIETDALALAKADIPSVLTAAGTAIAYADAYAAYAVYGLIGPAVAFVLLGLVALGTLVASLVHGPALAGLGLVGAFITPLIVSTEQPNYWALYLYLAVVTAASFALARARLWRWLAVTAVAASVLWAFPGIGDLQALGPHAFHIAAGFVLAVLLIVSGLLFGPDAAQGEIDVVSSGALAAYLFVSMVLVLATGHDTLALTLFVALVAGTIAIAWRSDATVAAVPAAAILVTLIFLHWSLDFDVSELGLPAGPVPNSLWKPEHYLFGAPLTLGAVFALLFGASGFLALKRAANAQIAVLWSASAVFAPLAILIALYCRIAGFDRSIPFAGAAVILAGAFALATEAISKRLERPGSEAASALFATGAIGALALALSLALEKGWLTVALALMVPGIAWIAEKRPWPVLRWLAAAVTMGVFGRIMWDPRIMGDALGTIPIFNWLLWGYGVPAASFWLAGHMLRRRANDAPARIVDAAAILFTVMLIIFEVRHYLTGDPYGEASPLAETALDVSLLLAVVIGLERIRLKSGSVIHDLGAQFLAAIVFVMIVFSLGVSDNPFFTGEPVGGPFINLILLGYGLPALLAGVLAVITHNTRPYWYSATAAATALGLALAYISLEIRTLYHGPNLIEGATTDAEQYTYSAVWLLFGVALLAAGIFLRSLPLRIASAAVVVLTVLKVFLIDMSDLTGIYRALSFLGLGAVLIGIGWFYQRLLFPRAPQSAEAPSEG
ncbi:MAG TPA: DUF2339 domain-containing protein [Methyloceanibacter sp.]|jgi:uncharacterized membrane protein|nr:DUF2339 domain-containing protein [Methyloceanibacter sp.]